MGRNPESIDAYRQAERLADDDIQRCRAWIGQGEGMRLIDQYQDALSLLEKAEKAATDNPLTAELAQIHHLRGNLYFPLGDLAGCLREHGASLSCARAAGLPEAEARALGGLGDAHYLSGRLRTAYDSFRRCVDLCRQYGLGHVEVANLPMVGWIETYTETLDRALETAAAAADMARKGSHHRAESQARSLVGFIKMEMGAFAEAREQMNLALDLSRKLKARRFEAHFLCDLAKLAHTQGHRADASKLVEQALSICRDTGMNYIGPTVLGCHARIADDSQTRKRALDEGESILRKGCASHNYFWFYRDAIEVCLNTGDWNAVERYAAALENYTRVEPLPWSDFFVARGRVLAAWGRELRDDALIATLRQLSGEAHRIGIELAGRELDDALRAV
jgi:tetratricopeptide (TPR) repeat protein